MKYLFLINLRSGTKTEKVGTSAQEISKDGQGWLVVKDGAEIVGKYALDTVAGWSREEME